MLGSTTVELDGGESIRVNGEELIDHLQEGNSWSSSSKFKQIWKTAEKKLLEIPICEKY